MCYNKPAKAAAELPGFFWLLHSLIHCWADGSGCSPWRQAQNKPLQDQGWSRACSSCWGGNGEFKLLSKSHQFLCCLLSCWHKNGRAVFALSCFSGDAHVCIQRHSEHGPCVFLLAANTIPALAQAKMGRKAGGSLNSVFPGGLHWFKTDLSHHWDNFWVSAFRDKGSAGVLQGFINLNERCRGAQAQNLKYSALCKVHVILPVLFLSKSIGAHVPKNKPADAAQDVWVPLKYTLSTQYLNTFLGGKGKTRLGIVCGHLSMENLPGWEPSHSRLDPGWSFLWMGFCTMNVCASNKCAVCRSNQFGRIFTLPFNFYLRDLIVSIGR